MSGESVLSILGRLELFSGLDPVRLDILAFTSERRVFEAGATLFEKGTVGEDAYLILEGEAAMLGYEGAGDQALAIRLQPGDLVGERALLAGDVRRSTVRAVTELAALRINRDRFLQLIREFPEMGDAFSRILRSRLGTLSDDLKKLSQKFASSEGPKEA